MRASSCVLLLAACSHGPQATAESARVIAFRDVGAHSIVVPVTVGNARPSQFILDTGIGLNLVSSSLCEELGCTIHGTYSGKRMSGQTVAVNLSTVNGLTLGSLGFRNAPVGVLDMAGFFPPHEKIEGFLSLRFFERAPFTVDFSVGSVTLENAASLSERKAQGTVVPVRPKRDGQTTSITLSVDIPGGKPALCEVDTGSDSLILHTRYMTQLGVDPASPEVKAVHGTDETGHEFVRYFTTVKGPIQVTGAPNVSQSDVKVMFQDIIHDGLMGGAFLSAFAVTYDLPDGVMVFGPLARPAAPAGM